VRLRLALFALMIGGFAASPAEAQLAVGFQSDDRVIEGDRETAYDHMQAMGGQWVRIMVRHDRWPQDADRYRAAIESAQARGLHVMATLMSWKEDRRATPRSWAAFTREVVLRYGWAVDAWGTANEPNHEFFRVATDTTCRISHIPAAAAYGSRVENGVRILTRYRRVKRGTGTHRKVVRYMRSKRGTYKRVVRPRRVAKVKVRRGTYRRVVRPRRVRYVKVRRGPYKQLVRFLPARGRQARYVQRVTKIPLSRDSTVWVSTEAARRQCEQQTWAAGYRHVHDAAARMIRVLDPTAKLVVGDLSPNSMNMTFMEAMIHAAPGPIDADVHGVHPYWHLGAEPVPGSFHLPNLQQVVEQARAWRRAGQMTGDLTWITEIGFSPQDPPSAVVDVAARAESLGLGVLIQYELYGARDRWDTGLLDPDGTPRPSWFALRDWLASRGGG